MRLEALKKFHHTIPAYLDVESSGVLLTSRSGSGESSSFVKTDEKNLCLPSGISDCVAISLK